jgi:hypothetical protein
MGVIRLAQLVHKKVMNILCKKLIQIRGRTLNLSSVISFLQGKF